MSKFFTVNKSDLLAIFECVGIELRGGIDDYFAKFNLKQSVISLIKMTIKKFYGTKQKADSHFIFSGKAFERVKRFCRIIKV